MPVVRPVEVGDSYPREENYEDFSEVAGKWMIYLGGFNPQYAGAVRWVDGESGTDGIVEIAMSSLADGTGWGYNYENSGSDIIITEIAKPDIDIGSEYYNDRIADLKDAFGDVEIQFVEIEPFDVIGWFEI